MKARRISKTGFICVLLIILLSVYGCGKNKDNAEQEDVNISDVTETENDAELQEVEPTEEPSITEQPTPEVEPEEIIEEINTTEYFCSLQDVIDNGDDTYTIKGSWVYEMIPPTITEEEYNSLSVGCDFPIECYYKEEGFHCVEANEEGYFFVDDVFSSLDELWSEDTTVRISKEDDEIKIFWMCPNSTYGDIWTEAETFERFVGDEKEFTMNNDTTVTLIKKLVDERNGLAPIYEEPVTIGDIGLDEIYSYYYKIGEVNDKSPGWHGFESLYITVNESGEVIDIRENLIAG